MSEQNRRVDVSHIKSPRDPMTPDEREEIRRQLQAEMAWVASIIREHGDPFGGMFRGWADFTDADLDDDAA